MFFLKQEDKHSICQMADGDRHAYDNRTEGAKGLPPRPGHVATSVEAEIPLGPSDHRLTRWCL